MLWLTERAVETAAPADTRCYFPAMAMRIGRAAIVLALALASVQATLTPASSPAMPAPKAKPGMIAFTPWGIDGTTAAERQAAYRRLRHLGARAIRFDFNWAAIERPGRPLRDYDFSAFDREVRIIRRAGLGLIGVLAYGHPDYSRLGAVSQALGTGFGVPPFGIGAAQFYPPDDPADFAHYARATARHFHRDVFAWEVWNEQNGGWRFWPPHEDPAAYGRLLCSTADAVRDVDPAIPVLFGGVFFPGVPPGLPGMSGPQFVRAAYDADPALGRCFDVMAYHPYAYPFTSPESPVPVRGSVLNAQQGMRDALPPADRDKPLWITEVGWPTHAAYGVPENKQAQYLARTLAVSFARGLRLVNLYTYGDFADPTGELNQEAHFGIYRADGTPKPAARAVRTLWAVLRGTRFQADLSRRLDLPPRGAIGGSGGGYALRFAAPSGRRVTALWIAGETAISDQGPGGGAASDEPPTAVRLPVRGRRVVVVDHLGGRRMVAAKAGSIVLEIGGGPQYVVEPTRDPTA